MGYYNPTVVTYMWPLFDFGGGITSVTHHFQAPNGSCGGVIRDIGLSVQERFMGTGSLARIDIGDASDQDRYASLMIPAPTEIGPFNVRQDTDAIIDANLPDTPLRATFVANGGSGRTGMGTGYIVIAWA